ncbi:GIY-YIG nuclease family protein [Clostridium sp. JNZ J1-5]
MKIIGGIYKIEDVETGNVYVGSADSDNGIQKRWSCHLAHLRNGEHYYPELQEPYKEEPNRIKWEILDICDDDELEERENYWINYCSMIDGWTVINKQKKAKRKGKVKDKSKMKAAQTGENNGHNTKLSVEDVKEIKKMLQKGLGQTELANKYDVSPTLIHNIKNGTRWASVEI